MRLMPSEGMSFNITILGSFYLKEVAGDILLTKADMVAHGVAPNDGYANGLALSLRQQWPAMYKDFRHYSQTFLTQRPVNCGPGPVRAEYES